jgi:hypothetical protein
MQRVFGAGLFVLLLGAGVANAAPECLAKPDRTAAPGSHWYYRIDRATQRQCWYLKQLDARAPAPAQPAAPRPEADSQPQLLSWLSSAFSNITRPAAPAPEPEVAAREPKRKATKRADVGRAPPRAFAQPAAAQPAAAAAEAPALDPAASEALYQQFLQWRVKQLLAPELPPDLQGGTLR